MTLSSLSLKRYLFLLIAIFVVLLESKFHQQPPFVCQTAGCEPDVAGQVLVRLTSNGNVPEALRLAHLIGAAAMTGQSSNRA